MLQNKKGNASWASWAGITAIALSINAQISMAASYTVATMSNTGGIIVPLSQTVPSGETAIFTIKAHAGYQATVIGCGGKLVGNTYTTGAITANCTVRVTFNPIATSYLLTVKKAGTGTGTVNGGGTFTAGARVTLRVTAGTGAIFSGWNPKPCAPTFTMPAKTLTCTATFTKIKPPALISVRSGCFEMGSPQGQGDSDEYPQHEVCLFAYEIGQYEVTVGQFQQFVKATGYLTDAEIGTGGQKGCWAQEETGWVQRPYADWKAPGFVQAAHYPVTCISWSDAVAYTQWLSKTTGYTYRLATEAEWEYACRARESHVYCGSNKAEDAGWFWENSGLHTHLIGQKAANAFALYDMSGNVSEWTCSLYESYGNSAEESCVAQYDSGYRMVRGGSHGHSPRGLRASDRASAEAAYRSIYVGFRVVREP